MTFLDKHWSFWTGVGGSLTAEIFLIVTNVARTNVTVLDVPRNLPFKFHQNWVKKFLVGGGGGGWCVNLF